MVCHCFSASFVVVSGFIIACISSCFVGSAVIRLASAIMYISFSSSNGYTSICSPARFSAVSPLNILTMYFFILVVISLSGTIMNPLSRVTYLIALSLTRDSLILVFFTASTVFSLCVLGFYFCLLWIYGSGF